MATEQEKALAELARIAKAIAQRDQAIVKARQAGIQQMEVMRILGVTRETVRRVERKLGFKAAETASA